MFSDVAVVETIKLFGGFIEIVRVDVIRVDAVVELFLAREILVYVHIVAYFVSKLFPHLTCTVNVRQGTVASSTVATGRVARAFTYVTVLAVSSLVAVAKICEVATDWRSWRNWSMGVSAALFCASPSEKVSARWSCLCRNGVAKITSVTRRTVGASKYRWTNGDLVEVVNEEAVSAFRTRTYKDRS